MTELSPWQLLVAKHYGDGDYAHVTTLEQCHDVGDTLFTFLMVELDPGEGCEDISEAVSRVQNAAFELNQIATLLDLGE